MSIGNAADAAIALTAPSEFYFDEGSERICYLIGGVIYKVEIAPRHGANAYEWDTYQNLCRQTFPRHITFARSHLFDINGHRVMASEYVQGQNVAECYMGLDIPCDDHAECIPGDVFSAIQRRGINDMSYGNVIRRGNQYVIVDMEG